MHSLTSDANYQQATSDAVQMTNMYDLACSSMLGRLLLGSYRIPNVGRPPEEEEPEPLFPRADETKVRDLLLQIKALVRQLYSETSGGLRDAVVPFFKYVDEDNCGEVQAAFRHLNSLDILDEPRSMRDRLIADLADRVGRYILFLTDQPPRFGSYSQPSPARLLLQETYRRTGWDVSNSELDHICTDVELVLAGRKGSGSGLRVSHAERADMKAWRSRHGGAALS